jgi:hypothetical protein
MILEALVGSMVFIIGDNYLIILGILAHFFFYIDMI